MALQDILAAISAQADQHIAEERSKHQKNLTQLREQGERSIAKKKQEIAQQKEQRKTQLKAKADNHAAMHVRNAELGKKKELLDRTYDRVAEELGKLPDDKVEPILRAHLKAIKGSGTIHPAKKHADLLKKLADSSQFKIGDPLPSVGGFRFVSEKQELDSTFEHIVAETLRPDTELEIAHMLFASA